MNRWKYSIVALTLLLGGCGQEQTSTALIEEPLSTRPIVAIIPVIDHSRHDLSWNISHELTQSIRQRLTQHDRLYLLNEDQVYAMTRKSAQDDPFGLETLWIKKAYSQNEFVAFFELIEHREMPIITTEGSNQENPAQLDITMRVRVFDLRSERPRVVLQEIVEQTHHIPRQFTRNQFNQVPWGDEMFEISPLGLAHEKICQEVASRVEDYILLNCIKK
jgi:hypothetical protein